MTLRTQLDSGNLFYNFLFLSFFAVGLFLHIWIIRKYCTYPTVLCFYYIPRWLFAGLVHTPRRRCRFVFTLIPSFAEKSAPAVCSVITICLRVNVMAIDVNRTSFKIGHDYDSTSPSELFFTHGLFDLSCILELVPLRFLE